MSLPWKPFFSFAFKAQKHINLLEIESALSLLRHHASEARRNCPVLAVTDSRAPSKGRSSSRRVNYLLKRVAALCPCYGSSSRRQHLFAWCNALPELPPVPLARLLSLQAENELRQLAEPFSANPCVSLQGGLGVRLLLQNAHQRPPRHSPLPLQSGRSLATCTVAAPARSSLVFCSKVPPARVRPMLRKASDPDSQQQVPPTSATW